MATAGLPAGKLTPQQFAAQWRHAAHQIRVNAYNFTNIAAIEASRIFVKSFDLGRFNSAGSSKWPQTSGEINKGGYPCGSLIESGSLKSSIKWKRNAKTPNTYSAEVFTDPKSFTGTFSHKGFCFANVHNADDSENVRHGDVANMPQRKFMPTASGDSTLMTDKFKELERILFIALPGAFIRT